MPLTPTLPKARPRGLIVHRADDGGHSIKSAAIEGKTARHSDHFFFRVVPAIETVFESLR